MTVYLVTTALRKAAQNHRDDTVQRSEEWCENRQGPLPRRQHHHLACTCPPHHQTWRQQRCSWQRWHKHREGSRHTVRHWEDGWGSSRGYDIQSYLLFPEEAEILLEPERQFMVAFVIPSRSHSHHPLKMLDTPLCTATGVLEKTRRQANKQTNNKTKSLRKMAQLLSEEQLKPLLDKTRAVKHFRLFYFVHGSRGDFDELSHPSHLPFRTRTHTHTYIKKRWVCVRLFN